VGNTASSLSAHHANAVNPQTAIIKQSIFKKSENLIKLVAVMSVVNLWKPQKLQSRMQLTESGQKWRFVNMAENEARAGQASVFFRIWSTPINKISAPFSSLLHKVRKHDCSRL
jgi:hypothetical protein